MSKADYIVVGLHQSGSTNLKTARTTFDYSPPIASEDISMNREELEAEETLGNRAPAPQEYGGRIFTGGITYFARPNSSPIFASMAFGSPTTSTPTGAVNARDHLFDPLGTNKEALAATLWLIKADPSPKIVDQLVGAKGNEYNLDVEANGYLGGSLGVSAVRLVTNATEPVGAVRDTTKKWGFTQVAANVSVNGAALAPIQLAQFGMSYSNNIVEDLFILGSNEVDDLPVGNITSEVTFTPTRNLQQHYNRALADNPDNVRLQLIATGATALGTGGDATLYPELEIDIKRALYTEAPANVNAGETTRRIQVTARPVLDDATSKLLLIRFRNAETGTKYQPATGA